MNLSQRLAAEFIGTFTLIFVGVSAICLNAGLAGIAFAHGLALVVMITALGHISGGHYNPAVTVGLLSGGKISGRDAIAYIIAQLLGAVVGALAVKSLFPQGLTDAAKLGTPMLSPDIGIGTGIVIEAILTFFLVTVVYGSAVDGRAGKWGGLFIGLTVTMDIFAGGGLTGAAMNPARTFGPALIGGYWDGHVVYWIGPILGGVAAGLLYTRWLRKEGLNA
ncbi:MAG: aquaporin [Ignavibacteriae bacterium]|nr:aquaporin [Ignavibacteria bacterium]MBI3363567.1 aquaporin [Ignavibacteriota bacterium]